MKKYKSINKPYNNNLKNEFLNYLINKYNSLFIMSKLENNLKYYYDLHGSFSDYAHAMQHINIPIIKIYYMEIAFKSKMLISIYNINDNIKRVLNENLIPFKTRSGDCWSMTYINLNYNNKNIKLVNQIIKLNIRKD